MPPGFCRAAFFLDAPVEDAYDITYDSLYCTDSYQALKAQAEQISEETGYVWIDANHWIGGQDISEDWSYSIKKIDIVTDSTASFELNVHNFNDQKEQARNFINEEKAKPGKAK